MQVLMQLYHMMSALIWRDLLRNLRLLSFSPVFYSLFFKSIFLLLFPGIIKNVYESVRRVFLSAKREYNYRLEPRSGASVILVCWRKMMATRREIFTGFLGVFVTLIDLSFFFIRFSIFLLFFFAAFVTFNFTNSIVTIFPLWRING